MSPSDAQDAFKFARLSEDIDHMVLSRQQIERRVEQLADEIARCYQGRQMTILAVMTGSLVFLADLIRRLPLMVRLNLISIRSYGSTTCSSGPGAFDDLPTTLKAADVLIIDDILDTGRTLQALQAKARALGPSSLRTCVLLKKTRPGEQRPEVDFAGFEIGDEFVVGYGLDFDNLYRNLPDVWALKAEAPGERG
jgi:hypoxanthine phosphoribosyltransferase